MSRPKKIITAGILFVLLIGLVGCADMPWQKNASPGHQTGQTVARHFEDIPIPAELKFNDHESFVFEASGFKAGTLYYSGYVDTDSLVTFFNDMMPLNGWRLKSTFRGPKIVLLFEKPPKACIIVIYEKTINTYVEIWVAPSA